jgi:hypothetical protein
MSHPDDIPFLFVNDSQVLDDLSFVVPPPLSPSLASSLSSTGGLFSSTIDNNISLLHTNNNNTSVPIPLSPSLVPIPESLLLDDAIAAPLTYNTGSIPPLPTLLPSPSPPSALQPNLLPTGDGYVSQDMLSSHQQQQQRAPPRSCAICYAHKVKCCGGRPCERCIKMRR